MNKSKGIALILCIFVILVVFILAGSLFYKVINENSLVSRYVNTVRAFWVAEAGIAEAINNLPAPAVSGSLGDYNYSAQTSYRTTINSSNYYDINSTGIVNAGGSQVSNTIKAIVKTGAVDPTKFQYGVAAANDLCFGGGGSCNKDPNSFLDPTVCEGHACWKEKDTTINFSDLFGYGQNEVEQVATHYTEATFPGVVSGITWVDVSPSSQLLLSGTVSGSGILIVNGDARAEGSYQFHGIIYILGTFDARGTFDSYGSIIVASTAGVDTINGTPTFHYDSTEITSALNLLALTNAKVVSWHQEQ